MDKAAQPVSVPTIVQRIQDAASREDKKKAIADLKNLSDNSDNSKVRIYVACCTLVADLTNLQDIGSAIPILINALKTERQDNESVKGLLHIFVNIVTVVGLQDTSSANIPKYS